MLINLDQICHPIKLKNINAVSCLCLLQGLEAHKYKNTLDCVMRIIKYEGLKA